MIPHAVNFHLYLICFSQIKVIFIHVLSKRTVLLIHIIIFNIHARVKNFFKRGKGISGGSEEQSLESSRFMLGNFTL